MKKLASQPISIFLAANDAYTQHLCAVMASILANSKAYFAFYILNQHLSEISKRNICALRDIRDFDIEFMSVDPRVFGDFEVAFERLSIEICYRLLIPQLLPNASRAIYLDCDVVVSGDLRDLWDVDLGDNYCAGVMEEARHDKATYKRLFGENPYFNSGVLLLNLDAIRRDFQLTDFLQIEHEHRAEMEYHDQDVLNIAFTGHALPLDARWNVTSGLIDKLISRKQDNIADNVGIILEPHVIHFAGPIKPWKFPAGICAPYHTALYFHYLRMTPYAGLEARMRALFRPLGVFVTYWWKHPFFFLRKKFYRQMYYRKITNGVEQEAGAGSGGVPPSGKAEDFAHLHST